MHKFHRFSDLHPECHRIIREINNTKKISVNKTSSATMKSPVCGLRTILLVKFGSHWDKCLKKMEFFSQGFWSAERD
uniref:Uncharacterized protein n=1 Tax=Pristionchus pacificus TaxID=54126 RepID=A0A2A6BCQ3_PRIPA|eukprot:PDM63663.1 hypothetical protein PRIPAC_49636 [Pristionchus pacificus]